MSKKSKPLLAHSELTECIYIIDGNDKYEVTEQCISAMKATNRMPRWIPCSERLPKEFESVLVCYKSQGGMAQAVSERFGTHTGYKWSALAGI